MSGFFAAGQYWDIGEGDTQTIRDAAGVLAQQGIENALKEARLLWTAAMPRRYADYGEMNDGTAAARFETLVARRAARTPMSHILGYRVFYKHRFTVTPEVLDPRPETEVLVTTALRAPFHRVLDLGTGSGAILLSLLAERPDATGVGTDLSEAALAVAQTNAQPLDLVGRAQFCVSDWFSKLEGQFDLIVSNPPYIAAEEMADLQPEVRLHEPRIALTDEADGLTAYRRIMADATGHLRPGGRLIVEIGPTQAQAVAGMMHDVGLIETQVIPDFDGRDRVVLGKMP